MCPSLSWESRDVCPSLSWESRGVCPSLSWESRGVCPSLSWESRDVCPSLSWESRGVCPSLSWESSDVCPSHFSNIHAVPESQGGLSLTRRGDFNAGSHINAFFRVHCKSSAPLGAASEVKALMAEKRHVTYFCKSHDTLPLPRWWYL